MWIFKGLIWESQAKHQAITWMNSNSFKDQTYFSIYLFLFCFWVRFLWLLHLVLLFGYVPCFLGTCIFLCFLTLHFSAWNLPGVLWPAGLGMALGFSVLAAVAWRAEVETPLMERMARCSNNGKLFMLDMFWTPTKTWKWWPSMEKGMPVFFVQLNDHVQVPFFLGGQYISVVFIQKIYV